MPNISLRDILRVLFKRKIQILVFFTVTVCAVAVGSLTTKPTYEAAAQILVKIGRENIYVPTLPAGTFTNPVIKFNQEEQINSEIAILKSLFLAQNVAESIGPSVIYEDSNGAAQGLLRGLLRGQPADTKVSPVQRAAAKLQQGLTIEPVKKSDVINISFKHSDPDIAARVVNALVSLYLDRHLQVYKNPQSYTFFDEQSQIMRNKLKQSEDNLESFKKQHNLTSLEEQRLLLLRNEADRRAALHLTLSQEAEAKDRLQQLRVQLAKTPKKVLLEQENDKNPFAISALQTKLAELELKEHELSGKYTDQSRLVQGVRDEIRMVQKKLAEQESRRYEKTRTGVNPVHQALQQDHLRTEVEVKALKAKEETQKAQLADYQKGLEKITQIEMEFNRLQQELEVNRQNYKLYLSKFEESRISNAMDEEKIANVSLIEPAQPPFNPVSPKIFLNMVLAVFLGGLGAVGLAFFSEYTDDRLEKTEDVEALLQLPVLVSIPELRK